MRYQTANSNKDIYARVQKVTVDKVEKYLAIWGVQGTNAETILGLQDTPEAAMNVAKAAYDAENAKKLTAPVPTP